MNAESDARNPDDGHRQLVWLDELCDRFEAAWNTSARVTIETVLNSISADKHPLILKHLLQLEVELRSRMGDSLTASELKVRFPDHTDIVQSVLRSPTPQDSLAAVRAQTANETLPPRSVQVTEDADSVPAGNTLRCSFFLVQPFDFPPQC